MKIKSYPPEPEVEFKEFKLIDTIDGLGNRKYAGFLTFTFVDGDGDLGFGQDSASSKAVFINKYEIINNVAHLVDLAVDYSYSIPAFSTTGNRKALKGEIVVKSLEEPYPLNSDDTIMYKFYIVDRSRNYSNTDSTGYIALIDFIER
jgi:hypothetical protein